MLGRRSIGSLTTVLGRAQGEEGAHAVELRLGLQAQGAQGELDAQEEPLTLRLSAEMLATLRAELQTARDQMAALPT